MKLRTVIIEDEPVNSRNLKLLLEEVHTDISIVKILASVQESVLWLLEHLVEVDLIFMDIRLTDGISFDILDRVKVDKPIIFATAYEEYALQAFNTHGIAYILKPYDKEDIKTALAKYESLTKPELGKAVISKDIIQSVVQEIRQQPHYKSSFLFHFQNKLIPVPTNQIAWFYSKNEVTKACTHDGKQYFIEDTLEHLNSILNPKDFFRANRQFLINRTAVLFIDFYFNGRLLVKVQPETEEQLIVSKAKATTLKNWLDL